MPELAEGTGPIEFDWLKNFYITAYRRLRDVDKGALPTDKAVVFHDGFRHRTVEGLHAWRRWQARVRVRRT